jgi:1,4-dihydroxy-2-naphthoate octaprenyltransferase
VLAGAALGLQRTGRIDALAALLALGAALLMQIVSNLQNDVGYTVRRPDGAGTHTGLPRATADGSLTVREVRAAIVLLALVAIAVGVALAVHRGWPVLAIGGASLAAGLAYMGGPRPIAYTPLGELTVFAFFGLVAVIGTDWLLTASVGNATVLAAMAIGALAAAALAVNNHRDIAHDRSVGRRTFAATFGEAASRRLFAALLAVAFSLVPAVAAVGRSVALLLPLLLVPRTVRLWRDFAHCASGIEYNGVLFRAFRLELAFAALLAAGAVLAHSAR